jgi:hypothetical protein
MEKRRKMDYIEKTITEYVRRNQEYPDHSTYVEYLRRMEKTPLTELNEIKVELIIKPFLYEWGKMGRVLGRKKFVNWEREIAEQFQSNLEKLEEFRVMHLVNTNLTDLKQDIIGIYESFKIIVDQVAATKALHIVCPNFFPLWDNAIRKAVKAELIKALLEIEDFVEKDFDLFRKKIEDFSGEDYYVYMRVIQYLVRRNKRTFLELANTYKKGELKVLDEFLWMAAHRPLSLFFQESSTM